MSVSDSTPAVVLQGFRLTVGEKELIRETDLTVARGEIVLLVGESGSGKTLFIKSLCGLHREERGGVRLEGSVQVDGHRVLDQGKVAEGPHGKIGIVFQDYGLIDELSADENLEFALRHRASSIFGDLREHRDRLIEEFDLPRTVPVSKLSGGQKQRLALARTLAYDPEILVYDEPTSGLDPALRSQVASRIASMNREHGKTSIVVTHDYDSLLEIADRVLVLNRKERRFEEVEKEELRKTGGDRASFSEEETGADSRLESRFGLSRLGGGIVSFFEGSARALIALGLFFWAFLPRWKSLRFGFYYAVYYFRLVALGSSLIYIGLAGGITGFVATYFAFEFLPHRSFTEPLLLDEVLAVLGYLLFRILVPVMATILIAARCGAAVSADVGNRVYSGQTTAMESLGAPVRRYLLTGVAYAYLIGGPLLVGVAFFVARGTSLLVFLYLFPEQSGYYWDRIFHRMIRVEGAFFPFYEKSEWVLFKVLAAAVGTGAISYFLGERPKSSGREVSSAVTGSVIWTTIFVLLVHLVFAFLEFDRAG